MHNKAQKEGTIEVRCTRILLQVWQAYKDAHQQMIGGHTVFVDIVQLPMVKDEW